MKETLLAVAMALGMAASAQAGYVYVGSWNVHSGPAWPGEPQIFTGRTAAAFIFGGSFTDYAISTTGSDPTMIDFQTWVSGWGMGHSGDIVGQDSIRDLNGDGNYNCCDAGGNFGNPYGDTSAYVQDWCVDGNCVNFAFKAVPEPTVPALIAAGLLGLGLTSRRKVLKG